MMTSGRQAVCEWQLCYRTGQPYDESDVPMKCPMVGKDGVMIHNPQALALLRQTFKRMNRLVLLQWRLGLGPVMNLWPEGLGAYLVIVHTGRKTGKKRFTPVNFAEVKGEVYCTAGFGSESHWYKNIMANPNVEIWLPTSRWHVVAEDVTDTPGALHKLRQVLINSGFVAPLLGLRPHDMNEDELAAETSDYRLIHFRRVSPAVGPGGPGELGWVWPLAALALLPLIVGQTVRRRLQHQ